MPQRAANTALARARKLAKSTPAAIEQQMSAEGMDSSSSYGPGRPLTPAVGYSQPPRARDYPLAINQAIQSRAQWGRTSFAVLRDIMHAYDVARMCINHKTDELRSM